MSKINPLKEFSKEEFDNLKVKELPKPYKAMSFYEIEERYRHLAGKVLTIIDASISEKQQLKAVKDLIKREFYIEIDKWQRKYDDVPHSPDPLDTNCVDELI